MPNIRIYNPEDIGGDSFIVTASQITPADGTLVAKGKPLIIAPREVHDLPLSTHSSFRVDVAIAPPAPPESEAPPAPEKPVKAGKPGKK